MGGDYELAMFPLEHAVVPSQTIPLHIFEPRYRQLAVDLAVADEPEFGIVGITRGREVGGAESRADIGVVARVIDSQEFADGRWSIRAVATRRVEVVQWLPDDPYPRARLRDRIDPDEPELAAAVNAVRASVRLLTQTHHPRIVAFIPDRTDDPGRALWELIAFAGFGPLDRLDLLAISEPTRRADHARALIDERRELLDALGRD